MTNRVIFGKLADRGTLHGTKWFHSVPLDRVSRLSDKMQLKASQGVDASRLIVAADEWQQSPSARQCVPICLSARRTKCPAQVRSRIRWRYPGGLVAPSQKRRAFTKATASRVSSSLASRDRPLFAINLASLRLGVSQNRTPPRKTAVPFEGVTPSHAHHCGESRPSSRIDSPARMSTDRVNFP